MKKGTNKLTNLVVKETVQPPKVDEDGEVIRHLSGPARKGFHRVTWDLRYASPDPTSFAPPSTNPFAYPPMGPMVVPGTYQFELARRVDGELLAYAR